MQPLEGVNVFGPLEVASGLGTAVRGHVRAMRAAGLRTRNFAFRFDPRQGAQRFDVGDEGGFFDISVVYANPDATDYVESLLGAEIRRSRRRIGVWVWELPAAREEHGTFARLYDEIWVPSSFNRRAFAAITRTPVHHVPYPVELAAPAARDWRSTLGLAPGTFAFLYMMDAMSYVERKNPLALVRAFRAAFGDGQSAALVLKVSHLDTRSPLAAALREAAAPGLHIVEETLDEPDLSALLHACDCYVSPHRTEGFGLTVAEAMLAGKPVIATDFGATRDFLDERTGFPVPYALVELESDLGPYPAGAVWAEPSETALAERMRHVVSNTSEARTRAQAGYTAIRDRYGITAVARALRARLQDHHDALGAR